MKKFRIGIDARMYGSKQTGIGIYIEHLLRELACIDKVNEYFVFLLPAEFNNFKINQKNFHKIEVTSHWYSFKEQSVFLKDILRYKLNLMHFTHFNLPIFYPRRFVITIHDITPKFFPGHKMGKSWYRRKAYDLIVKRGTKNAKIVITPSHKTEQDLINFYKVDKNKIKVIHEGIKNKISINERKEFLENYSQRKEIAFKTLKSKFYLKSLKKPYIFYVGVWRDHKNLKGLVQSFDILVKKYNFKGILVLGGKEDEHYLETQREWELKRLGNKIIRPGFLSGEKLTLFYQAADLFVLPSFYEGFGLVCLEALNQGTAVACSDIDPLKEVLNNAALYFNPQDPEDMANKIWKVLISKKLQKELLLNAQNVLEKYSWTKMIEETFAIYMKSLK